MTTQDLSRKLCEICGIKPIYKVLLDGTLMNITEDKDLAEISAFESGGVIIDAYPDFTLPENFVKLFELNIPDSNVTVGAAVCFCNYLNPNNLRTRFWYPLLKLCGIDKRVRLHDLRGSYIDMVLSSGLSVKFAQNQAGHAKSETTLNIYARNNADMIEKATERIGNIFSKKYEQKESKKENSPNKKIIQFPKRLTGIMF